MAKSGATSDQERRLRFCVATVGDYISAWSHRDGAVDEDEIGTVGNEA